MNDQTQARDASIVAVAAASIPWRTMADRALRDAAVSRRSLTSDDVWKILKAKRIPAPSEPRAMGPVMMAGVRSDLILQTDQTRISSDPSTPNHNRPQRVYLSQVYGEAPAKWGQLEKVAVDVDGITRYFDISPVREESRPKEQPKQEFMFSELPKKIDFGIHALCPRCHGVFRTVKGVRQKETLEPHDPKKACTRCGGIGLVPNIVPIP